MTSLGDGLRDGPKQLLSPRQVARAIGISESSLKRWCDRGIIPSIRTAGGHRRLRVSSVIQFVRSSGCKLVEPDVLGLPATAGRAQVTVRSATVALLETLLAGDESTSRRIFLDLYLAGQSLSVICDEVIAPLFYQIGALWSRGDVQIYQERRSCEICLRLLYELRSALPPLGDDAPSALGASLEGDHYLLPTSMAGLVLRERGWSAISLGNSLPAKAIQAAIEEHRPKLIWLAVSHIADRNAFTSSVSLLYQAALRNGAALVMGGRALSGELRKQLKYSAFCDTMQHLEMFAASIRAV